MLRLASRGLIGVDVYALIFVAPTLALGWAVLRAVRWRSRWSWPAELPVLVLASLATAPFAWVYDEVVAVLPLVQLAAVWSAAGVVPRPHTLVAFVAFDVAVLAMNVARVDPFWYVWTPFALLVLYASSSVRDETSKERALRVA